MTLVRRWTLPFLAALIFAIDVYRAATMSLTIDEATTYVGYVHLGWNGIFHGPFDANNHILYSILEKFSRQWFGMSELSLRLPVLLGAALFLWSLVQLCARLMPGQFWLSLLAFLIVAANPLALDFMVAARGYGLALGLLAFALLQWLEWIEDKRPRRVWIASVALGLSVAANLIFAFPALATLLVAALFLLARRQFQLLAGAILPALIIPVALWWVPFEGYNKNAFYFGAATLYEAAEAMQLSLFVHDITRGDPFGNWWMLFYMRIYLLPWLLPALWIGALFWLRSQKALAFATLVFAVTCFGSWLAHVWLGVLYPQERTGLALIFLFLLTWTAAIAACWQANRYTRWLLAFPNLLLALVFLAQFAGQFDIRYFGPWRTHWEMDKIMGQLSGSKPGRIRTHWLFQSTAEYYRLRWKMPFEPIAREADKFELNNADYFILPLSTDEDVAATGLRVVYRDEITGTTLLTK